MKRMKTFCLPAALLFACCPGAWAAGKAHEHGIIRLDVVVDDKTLAIEMNSPMDSLLGFERAPRTDSERKAAAALMTQLRSAEQATRLFAPDPAAQCASSKIEVLAPVLDSAPGTAGRDGHADVEVRYEFTCARPEGLRKFDTGIFAAYPRVQRVEVRLAQATGQSRLTLKRPARIVNLGP